MQIKIKEYNFTALSPLKHCNSTINIGLKLCECAKEKNTRKITLAKSYTYNGCTSKECVFAITIDQKVICYQNFREEERRFELRSCS